MIYPSISDLSDKGVNRYALSIATAKCARIITDEQAERQTTETVKEERFQSYNTKKQVTNEKPVKEAIEKLYTREYKIVLPEEK